MIYDLQKANFYKRISAFLFDIIVFAIVAIGIAALLSWILGYDAKLNRLEEIYSEYEEEYGIVLDISAEDFEKLSKEEKAKYELAQSDFEKDVEVIYITDTLFSLSLLMITLSLLFAFLILEFAIPLFLRNGQTLGKKIFGVAVMCESGIKITPFVLFIRSILGKYTIETMVPIFILFLIVLGNAGIVGVLALFLLIAFEIGLLIKTKTNYSVHDILSYTVAVDMASQMIFDSKEDLIAYKNKIHAEDAEKKTY